MWSRNRIARSLLVMASIVSAASSAKANPEVYQNLVGSTVLIWSDSAIGSGVLVDVPNRLIVTNYHVVGELEEIHVSFPACYDDNKVVTDRNVYFRDFEALRASHIATVGRVVERLKQRDLAVIQLDQLPEGAAAIPLADTSAHAGDRVHSIGNPGASDSLWVYTPGEVRQVYRKRYVDTTRNSVDSYMLETTSPINPGDSGGPMVNDDGELVGVVVSSHPAGYLITNQQGKPEFKELARLVSNAIDVREIRWLLQTYSGADYDRLAAASDDGRADTTRSASSEAVAVDDQW